MQRKQRIGLYVGGLLGPFGGGVVVAILPEIGETYGVSAGTAATSLTAYLLPFAVVMLASGTLGDKWGIERTTRVAYAVYALAALLSVVAPWFWLFQASRGMQGVANAFTTPLLMAKLAAITPANQLGRALGFFGAMQAIGLTSAPLVGGLAAELSWQWAFVGIAIIAGVLTVSRLPPDAVVRPPAATARWRDAWSATVLGVGAVALFLGACLAGLAFLVAFRLTDAFSLSPGMRGLVLTAFGVAGALSATAAGAATDRFGRRASVCVGLLVGSIAIGAIGLSTSLPAIVVAWALAGVGGQLVVLGVNATVLARSAGSRGGAISVVTAMRFLGMATAPAALSDMYRHDPMLGFLVPAGILLLLAPVVAARWPGSGKPS